MQIVSQTLNRLFSSSSVKLKNSRCLKQILLDMPRNKEHIQTAQNQRVKIRDKAQKYVPGCVQLQILGCGTEGAPRALYVFSDHSRYLFNCGEGTQRLAHEHKMKLSRLEHVFITQPVWSNLGGLPGLSLTIQDVGVPFINLHGPPGLDELFAATHRFVVLQDLQVIMASGATFEDNVMTVSCVRIEKTGTSDNNSDEEHQVDDDTDYYSHETSGKRTQTFTSIPNERRDQNMVMSYICRLQPRPGTLCLEKCVDAGVPPGPLLGRLKNGEDVELNGKIVKSVDVRLPDDPGAVFLVVDCSNLDFIDDFVNAPEWNAHFASAVEKDEDNPVVVVHFTPRSVMLDVRYQNWMNKFSASTIHLAQNSENKCFGSSAVHRVQHQLNLLDNKIFPLLFQTNPEDLQPPLKKHCGEMTKNGADENVFDLVGPLQQAKTMWSVHLRPKKGLDRSQELLLNSEDFTAELMKDAVLKQSIDELLPIVKNIRTNNNNLFPKILFLGTGSCIPNKTRNTSGILVELSPNDYFLMDCGEGTFGQILRFYGREKSAHIFARLRAVYVSHLHADHHIGLVGLLSGRRRILLEEKIPCPRLFLIAPRQIINWLTTYHRRFERVLDEFELVSNHNLLKNSQKIEGEIYTNVLNTLKLSNIQTTFVRHCPNAFGVSFETQDGVKITYSGDTMPCDALVDLGSNSDILIHEATMEDELVDEARIKLHSTTSQAIEVGNKMNAKNIILTHFSQRYARLPRISDEILEKNQNISVAFDYMKVDLEDLKVLPKYYPVLKMIFKEHFEELEVKAAKRQLKLKKQMEKLHTGSSNAFN